MFNLLLAEKSETEIIISVFALIVAVLAIIVTVVLNKFESVSKKKEIILNKYEEIYNDIFELRKKVSNIIGYQWYYEVSAVEDNLKAKELIVDYLNKVCNIFVFCNDSKQAKNLWLKMIPPKLFERLFALYPYIVYSRKVDNYKNLFNAYCELIEYYCTKEEFKKRYFDEQKVIWVGIRDSDTQFSKDSTETISITVFGEKIDNEKIRPNQNVGDVYSTLIDRIYAHENMQGNKYMFYNQKLAYALNQKKRQSVLAINSEPLLKFLNNKLQMRHAMSKKGILCIPSETVYSTFLDYNNLCTHFNTEKIIIQKVHGGGGYGTFIADPENASIVIDKLKKMLAEYLVTPYYEKSTSTNVHIVISNKQTAIFPGSIQIIERHKDQLLYRGADFISFRELSQDVKNAVQVTASKIANYLRSEGYRGVAGIDLLIYENNVYFLEINPRFQASSILIDKYLQKKYVSQEKNIDKKQKNINLDNRMATNLIEINKNAFNGLINTDISFNDVINYSCYYYYADNHTEESIRNKLMLLESSGIHVDKDGFNNNSKIDSNSYLYRAIFNDKITQISPDGDVWINDNIKIGSLPKERLKLKISLLNQGVRLCNNIKEKYKKAAFNSIDFYVNSKNFYINSPVDSKWVNLSPYALKNSGEKTVLTFYDLEISEVIIETDQIDKNIHANKCLFLSTDRLRISPAKGCQFKAQGSGCLFCNVDRFAGEYTLQELKSATDWALNTITPPPRHIMIGGGTVKNLSNIELILNLVIYIRQINPEIEITLMSIPPLKEDLVRLKDAGITDVSFNIEIFNEKLAKEFMPAKSEYERSYYFEILRAASNIWNEEYGNVRSIALVGLDNTKDLFEGIKTLKEIGVQPVLSIFRPLKESVMYYRLPPSNDYLFNIYNKVQNLLKPIGELGPKCESCRNNTLAI